ARHHSIHFQPIPQALRGFETPKQAVSQLVDAQPGEGDSTASTGPAWAEMFIKIPVAAAIAFQFKANRETIHGLTAQMGDRRLRCVHDCVPGVPHPQTYIDLFLLVEKLLVKSPQTLQ